MRVLKSVAIAVASLVVFFGAAEAIARLCGFRPHAAATALFSWAERGELYTMTPNRPWVLPGNLKLVRVNGLGLRGPEIGEKHGLPRIVVLGDSVAFGYDVAEKEAIPARLQKALWTLGTPVEVINAAIPGWCARQHRVFLERYARELAPEVVLATVVLNDVPELQKGRAELAAAVDSANALGWLAERLAVAALVRARLQGGENPFAEAASVRQLALEPDAESSRRGLELEIEELRRLAEAAGGAPAHVGLLLLPFKFQLETPDADAPQRRLKAFAREERIPALDLLPVLRRYDPDEVFVDQVHLSALGNEVVADAVATWLLRLRMVGPRARPVRTATTRGRRRRRRATRDTTGIACRSAG